MTGAANPSRIWGGWRLVLSLLLATGCTSPPQPHGPHGSATSSTSVPAPSTVEQAPRVSPKLGPAPTGCQDPSPRLHVVNRRYGPLFGERPLWGGFYAKLSHGAFLARQAPRTKWGWRIKVLWIMEPEQTEPVAVTGGDTATGRPLWFQISGTKPTTQPRFDPSDPVNTSQGNWKEFSSYLFFPRAACYRITENWPSGTWSLTVGLGG